ncbi:MAG: hypothetical protein Q9212_003774 [Teloschistes hypoglaucus]
MAGFRHALLPEEEYAEMIVLRSLRIFGDVAGRLHVGFAVFDGGWEGMGERAFSVVLLLSFLLPILSFTFAQPINQLPPRTISKNDALTTRSPSLTTTAAINTSTLSKRALSFALSDGWWFVYATKDEYSQIYTAITALARFYTITLAKLELPPSLDLQSPAIKLSDPNGPFQLFFRLRNANDALDHVPMALVRLFVQSMLGRVESAWPAEYRGWLRGPGGLVIEVILKSTGSVMRRSDSAMDFHDGGE